MAQVWSGRHTEEGVDVAIKIMSLKAAEREDFLSTFRDEVRAVAGLTHPNIITVLDYGDISQEVTDATEGRLPVGTPYLVMELAEPEPLVAAQKRWRWSSCQELLLHLLDALAHSHARGVVHRDIKPGNILRGVDGLPRLSDFGLAHLRDAGAPTLSGGTPSYMAPEQLTADWRSFGPWTDLYALGCVAWKVVSGTAPFGSLNMDEAQHQHLSEEPPELKPRVAVPPQLEPWLRRLLVKDPNYRYRRAADAADALSKMDTLHNEEDDGSAGLPSTPMATLFLDGVQGDTLIPRTQGLTMPDERTRSVSTSHTITVVPPPWAPDAPEDPNMASAKPPPLPIHWQRPGLSMSLRHLDGAGLNLYGLRSLPLVGRNQQRDALWQSLLDTSNTGRARMVVLQGAAGCGKSRLAQWFGRRAHEVGAAIPLLATHSPIAGPTDGLGPMAGRHLNIEGLSRTQTARRVHSALSVGTVLPTDEVNSIMALATEFGSGTAMRVEERHGTLRRVLELCSAERPVILWMDDVQWGLDALMFAEHLLEAQEIRQAPVLIVATVRSEALPEQPAEADMLSDLQSRPDVVRVEVPPLEPEHHKQLVRGLLGLEDSLASLVEQRTAGNPLFAVHLVGDWVSRNLLCRPDTGGASGFRLKLGAKVDLPDDLHAVWASRVEALMARRPAADGIALEVAAVLGQEVDFEEWFAATKQLGVVPGPDLAEALVRRRLAQHDRRKKAWSFVHGMLRESLERRSREAGRFSEQNLVCARVVQERGGSGSAARIGRHLLAAGREDDAIAPLLEGAVHALSLNQVAVANDLLSRREQALHRLATSIGDPRWGAGWVYQAATLRRLADVDQATKLASRALESAKTYSWHGIESRARSELAIAARQRGDLPEAERNFIDAMSGYESSKDFKGQADTLIGLCHVSVLKGDLAKASELAQTARAHYTTLKDTGGIARCVRFDGDIARLRRQWNIAEARFREAMELHRELGDRAGVAANLHGIAEVLRFRGEIEDAEQVYRQVILLEERVGNAAGSTIPKLNLALCLIQRRHWPDAAQALDEVYRTWSRRGQHGYLGCAHAAMTPCAAGMANWTGFDDHLQEARKRLQETGMVDPDIAWPMQLAGDLAARAGQHVRAAKAWQIARDQWKALDNQDRVAQIEAALSGRD